MKVVEKEEATAALGAYAEEVANGPVVVTDKGKPVAVLVPLENADVETVALSTNRQFIELIERSRASVHRRRHIQRRDAAAIWLLRRDNTRRRIERAKNSLPLASRPNRPRHTEAKVEGTVRRHVLVTVGTAAQPGRIAERAASPHPAFATLRPLRINSLALRINPIPVRTPFPYIAVHVVQARRRSA